MFFHIRAMFLSLFILSSLSLFSYELNQIAHPAVVENKKIDIPCFPSAFNPSVVRWKDSILMCFRVIPDPGQLYYSRIGFIWLDENFTPKSFAQLVDTRSDIPYIPSRSEDARLITVGDRLFIIYNDNLDPFIDLGVRRLFLSEIFYNKNTFRCGPPIGLYDYDYQQEGLWEKNWVPFDYNESILLAYSINPHIIFQTFPQCESCQTLCASTKTLNWSWGTLRGGSPAIAINDDEYLSFAHSMIEFATPSTKNKKLWHYFIAAYTFGREPPFEINKISPYPIVATNMYSAPTLSEKVVIYPGGFIHDAEFIWVVYGRNDAETWVLKMHKQKLLDSLIPGN